MTKKRQVERPHVEESVKRGPPIGFRPTPDERVLVVGKAAEAGLTISDYCRLSATGKTIYRNDNVPMGTVGVMRSAGLQLQNALNEGRKGALSPAAMTSIENATEDMGRAFRSIFHRNLHNFLTDALEEARGLPMAPEEMQALEHAAGLFRSIFHAP
jgi:hypothetical protein